MLFPHPPSRTRPRTWGTFAAVGLLAAALSVLPAGPALAHSALLSTDPLEGATLDAAPEQVTLVFNEDVAPAFVDGAITVGASLMTAVTATVDAGTVVMAVPSQLTQDGAGQPWQVDYRVVSADGHPISGSVSFAVQATPSDPSSAPSQAPAPPSTTPSQTSATELPGLASPDPATSTPSTAAADQGPGDEAGGTSGLSTVALSTGLAGIGGAVAGVVIVMVRRRRRRL